MKDEWVVLGSNMATIARKEEEDYIGSHYIGRKDTRERYF